MYNRHRIFIAINLPFEIKQELVKYQKKWNDFPAKWVSEDNLHITLVFLGDLTDLELGEVCVITKEITQKFKSFDINLTNISYGPASNASRSNAGWPEGKIPPKMIWAMGDPPSHKASDGQRKSKELSLLKKDLEESLGEKIHPVKYREAVISPKEKLFNRVNFLKENREFRPHITLARVNAFDWRSIEVEERPEIEENIDLMFTVESIDVMESELKRGGPQYTVIESFSLS